MQLSGLHGICLNHQWDMVFQCFFFSYQFLPLPVYSMPVMKYVTFAPSSLCKSRILIFLWFPHWLAIIPFSWFECINSFVCWNHCEESQVLHCQSMSQILSCLPMPRLHSLWSSASLFLAHFSFPWKLDSVLIFILNPLCLVPCLCLLA